MTENPHERDSEQGWVERGTDVERTVYFSEAAFAIAITLLALEIRVPEVPDNSAALQAALLGLWPRFLVSWSASGSSAPTGWPTTVSSIT